MTGVGRGVGHAGKGVGKGAFGLAYRATHKGHGRHKSQPETTEEEEAFLAAGSLKPGHTAQASVIDPQTGQAFEAPGSPGRTAAVSNNGLALPNVVPPTPTLEGFVRVTIAGIEIEGVEKPIVVIKQNGKTLEKTNSQKSSESQFGETFIARASQEVSTVNISVL